MKNFKNILITGGSGFIGTNLIISLLKNTKSNIYNLDKLSYSSNQKNLDSQKDILGKELWQRYHLLCIDLVEKNNVESAIETADPDIVVHLAAESHVDRSISSPEIFINSNILGTFNLLQSSLFHYRNLNLSRKKFFKFYHISTDEVFGSLNKSDPRFNESTIYDPRSPYSASKASSDHLVNAWHHTYGLPIVISNCSNNYGPWQYPEKLIPLTITKALSGEKIPVYGNGENIRDWLYVEDHVKAIKMIMNKGLVGKKYCIGGSNEISNLEVVNLICENLDQLLPRSKSYKELISFVKDRPGHDYRYSVDSSYLKNTLGWKEELTFQEGLRNTVIWYLENLDIFKNLPKKD